MTEENLTLYVASYEDDAAAVDDFQALKAAKDSVARSCRRISPAPSASTRSTSHTPQPSLFIWSLGIPACNQQNPCRLGRSHQTSPLPVEAVAQDRIGFASATY
jgi:hypothetical protein